MCVCVSVCLAHALTPYIFKGTLSLHSSEECNVVSVLQDVNTTRYHVLLSGRLLKTELQAAGYKQTMLGFSYRLAIFPRDGKVPSCGLLVLTAYMVCFLSSGQSKHLLTLPGISLLA